MRLRTFTASLVVAAAATLPLAGVATAQPDRNCDDFSSQAEAQAALRPGDPDDLDGNGDGRACENQDYGSSPARPADEDDESRDQPRTEDDESRDESREDGDEDGGSDDGADDGADDDGQVSVVPRGGVDTGDGSSTPGSAPFVIAGAVAAAVAAGAVRRRAGASR